MQFGDGEAGAALIYKRAQAKGDECRIRLNGLVPDRQYTVFDYDEPDAAAVYTGEALMSEGLPLTISEAPKAVILQYRAVDA